jgi:hypothetical protein
MESNTAEKVPSRALCKRHPHKNCNDIPLHTANKPRVNPLLSNGGTESTELRRVPIDLL